MYQVPLHLKGCAGPLMTETWDRMFSPLRLDPTAWWSALKEIEPTIRGGLDGALLRLLTAEFEYWMYCYDSYAY